MSNDTRIYYIQRPVDMRGDDFFRKLESKFGRLATLVFEEIHGIAAKDPDFIISYETDDETFVEQLAFSARLEGDEELVKSVLDFCLKKKMVERVDSPEGVESYFFPWSKEKTTGKSQGAERQARWRRQQEGLLQDSNGPRNICYANRNVCYSAVTESNGDRNKRNDSKSKRVDIDKEKDIEKETDIEKELEVGRAREDPPTNQPQNPLLTLPLPGGKTWSPSEEERQRLTEAFPQLDLAIEFGLMTAWCARTGGVYSGGNVAAFVWRWMKRSQEKLAREMVEQQRHQSQAKTNNSQIQSPNQGQGQRRGSYGIAPFEEWVSLAKEIAEEEQND